MIARDARYNDTMAFAVVRAPSRRLSRPHERRKFYLQQLQSENIDEATRTRWQHSLLAVEAELDRTTRVRWTKRDHVIVQIVDELGFATAEQVERRMSADPQLAALGTSRRGISNRMKMLYAHAWLDRPALQRALLYEHNASLIYTLGPAGARFLNRDDRKITDRSAKRKAVPLTLAHELEVNDALLTFRTAVQQAGLIFLDQNELVVPELKDASIRVPHPFGCKVSVAPPHLKDPIQLTAIPDRAFAVLHPDGARHTFLLEWDRQSMSVGDKRTRLLGKSSFIKKLYAYHAIWRQKLHEERWGVTRWRLLTITPSEKRIGSLLKAQRYVTGDRLAGLFLYSTPERLAKQGVLGPAWISAESDQVRIIEPSKVSS